MDHNGGMDIWKQLCKRTATFRILRKLVYTHYELFYIQFVLSTAYIIKRNDWAFVSMKPILSIRINGPQ